MIFFPTDLAMDILCPCFLHAMKILRPPRILLIRGSPRGPICNCTTQQFNFKYLRNHPVLFLDTFWPTKIPLVFKILLSNIQHWMRLVVIAQNAWIMFNTSRNILLVCRDFFVPTVHLCFPPNFFHPVGSVSKEKVLQKSTIFFYGQYMIKNISCSLV